MDSEAYGAVPIEIASGSRSGSHSVKVMAADEQDFFLLRRRSGRLCGAFVVVYGVFRFLVEFVREPDRQLVAFAAATDFHMGQWLCVPMILGDAGLTFGRAGIRVLLRTLRRPDSHM